jgi:hypothetical protein
MDVRDRLARKNINRRDLLWTGSLAAAGRRVPARHPRRGAGRYRHPHRVEAAWAQCLRLSATRGARAVMGFRAWRETPGLRRWQRQQRLQFTPGFAIILGSIHRAQFRSRVERARLR